MTPHTQDTVIFSSRGAKGQGASGGNPICLMQPRRKAMLPIGSGRRALCLFCSLAAWDSPLARHRGSANRQGIKQISAEHVRQTIETGELGTRSTLSTQDDDSIKQARASEPPAMDQVRFERYSKTVADAWK